MLDSVLEYIIFIDIENKMLSIYFFIIFKIFYM